MKSFATMSGSRMLLKTSIFIMGVSGIMAQIILLRQLLIVSFGNELIIGIVLSNWLLFEALGSWLAGRLKMTANAAFKSYLAVQTLFAFVFPLAVIAIRFAKDIMGVHDAGGLGFMHVVFFSLIVLLPVSFLHGSLFTLNCRVASKLFAKDTASISKVYVIELLGTTLGGILVYVLMIINVPALHSTIAVSILNILVLIPLFSVIIPRQSIGTMASGWQSIGTSSEGEEKQTVGLQLLPSLRSRNPTLKQKPAKKTGIYFLGGCVVILIIMLLSGTINKLDKFTIDIQWRLHDVLHYQNSAYGNIVVTKEAEQRTFFYDGQPIIISPEADISFVETLAHLSLTLIDKPQNVLITGGGAGGILREVLKHPVSKVDYTELDPLLIEILKKYPTDTITYELSHPAVNLILTDGRKYVESTGSRYDVVIIGIDSSYDLQTNRLFTAEFFDNVSRILTDEGVLAFMKTGSFSYLSEDLRYINKITENSLRSVFEHVFILPCETNLFLASNSDLEGRLKPRKIDQRLVSRDISTKMFSLGYLEYLFQTYRQEWYREQVEGVTNNINYDLNPHLLFWSISYWNSLVAPESPNIFQYISRLNYELIFIILIVFLCLSLLAISLLFKKRIVHPSFPLPYAVMFSGFVGMIFDLALIYSFQVIYGYVFAWIGMLFVAFMIGAACGASFSKKFCVQRQSIWTMGKGIGQSLGTSRGGCRPQSTKSVKQDNRWMIKFRNGNKTQQYPHEYVKRFMLLELLIIIFAFFILLMGEGLLRFVPAAHPLLFLILPFAAGMLIGAQFPIAVQIYDTRTGKYEKSAGSIYSADLLGGFFGGIAGGVILLPFLGLTKTMLLVIVLKIFSVSALMIGFKAVKKGWWR